MFLMLKKKQEKKKVEKKTRKEKIKNLKTTLL